MSRELGVAIGDLWLRNPVIAASGTFGFGQEYGELYDLSCLGAMCTKAITLRPRTGNPPPRLWETSCGLLNSIGLQNPGLDAFLAEELPKMRRWDTRIIVNVWGETVEEYQKLASRLSRPEVDALELNVSCPNVPGPLRGARAEEVERVVRAVREVWAKPLWVKLPPEGEVLAGAVAAQQAGADAISAVNTFRSVVIDIQTGRPVFASTFGGLSGPAIKPVALRFVYELCQQVSIPVIGIGGITTWQDAVEYIMAGAHAVQVGTGNFIDPFCIPRLVQGLQGFLEARRIESWEEIRGCAQRT